MGPAPSTGAAVGGLSCLLPGSPIQLHFLSELYTWVIVLYAGAKNLSALCSWDELNAISFMLHIIKQVIMQKTVLFINPGSKRRIYQALSQSLSAIEPPYWCAMEAAYLREKGVEAQILDAAALGLSPEETAEEAARINPLLCLVYAFGTNPQASTPMMDIVLETADFLAEKTDAFITLGGLHPTVLYRQTLWESKAHAVIRGEGGESLFLLYKSLASAAPLPGEIPGLAVKDKNGAVRTGPPKKRMKQYPGPAWNLLPMHLYRAHNWHCLADIDTRSPYAVLATSFGCPCSCSFCSIHGFFGEKKVIYRNPEAVVEEAGLLAEKYGVRNIKIPDEIFLLNPNHYLPILQGIVRKGLDLNIWAYSRVDTLRFSHLPLLKQAGVNWLALGIESGDMEVLRLSGKQVKKMEVEEMVSRIRDQGIYVLGNYLFGLPGETGKSMEKTLELSLSLNTEFANFNCAMAYPGSALYDQAVQNRVPLPDTWSGYAQHGRKTLPLGSRDLTGEEVLRFRDRAFLAYFRQKRYLDMIESVFGKKAKNHIQKMTETILTRPFA